MDLCMNAIRPCEETCVVFGWEEKKSFSPEQECILCAPPRTIVMENWIEFGNGKIFFSPHHDHGTKIYTGKAQI